MVQSSAQQSPLRPRFPSSHCSPASTTEFPHGLRLPRSSVGLETPQAQKIEWQSGDVNWTLPVATKVFPAGSVWPCKSAPQSWAPMNGKVSMNAPVAESIVPVASIVPDEASRSVSEDPVWRNRTALAGKELSAAAYQSPVMSTAAQPVRGCAAVASTAASVSATKARREAGRIGAIDDADALARPRFELAMVPPFALLEEVTVHPGAGRSQEKSFAQAQGSYVPKLQMWPSGSRAAYSREP